MAVQTANTVYAGPTSGSPAEPTFRELVYADFNSALRAALLADVICNIGSNFPQWLEFALSPFKTGAITKATAGTWVDRPPAFEFVDGFLPRASRITTSGLVTIDIKFGSSGGVGGTSIFSTKLTIDDGERTSITAATPCVLSTSIHTDDTEMAIIVEGAGTDTEGLLLRLPVFWTVFD
jgi:hypothetical protein